MDNSDTQILDELSEKNWQHMLQSELIHYFVLWIFRGVDTVIGYTKKEVDRMTQYEKICFLEEIVRDHSLQTQYREVDRRLLIDIEHFVSEIAPYKDGFKCCTDLERRHVPRPIWKASVGRMGIQNALIDRLRFHGGLLVSDIAEKFGISINTARRHIERLVGCGLARVTLGTDLYSEAHVRYISNEN